MKKFCVYIVGGILVILAMISLLDVVYTKTYETSYPRTKFQYLRSLKNKKVDYIFLGSSRVESGIVPSIIYNKTGKLAVNLGFQAAKLGDIYTSLQLIKAYNIHFEKILIQVDYIYNYTDGNSNIFQYEMTPFLRENSITKQYFDNYGEDPIANYYIPFYRYCYNDLKLGFREVFANVIHKKNNVLMDKGYGANYGNTKELRGVLPVAILDSNIILDSIASFSKQNNIEVVYYCAPFCKKIKNIDFIWKLKNKIPELEDFSEAVNDDKMFLNCNHLNDSGAKRFTEILTKKLLTE
ncbi:hypothetical protein [Flavobacterium sp. XS2P39]|uniref:hypothetical protein n=1 Tax=Flavobacterium sp. XS2P39 TaxID=3401725 RepID=UPI003AAE6CEE